jgi:transcriptional regulator with XRE-family HTH domain
MSVVTTQPTPVSLHRLQEGSAVAPSTFGELLRRLREQQSKTQAEVAEKIGVSRVTFGQWESDKFLPQPHRVGDLDELLGAAGELIALAGQARPAMVPPPVQAPAPRAAEPAVGGGSLVRLFADIRRAFLDQLVMDDPVQLGWRHNLVPSDEPTSTLSTAYGLKALAMLGGPDARTPAVVDSVLKQAIRDDDGRLVGWKARLQFAPRLETTAAALDALLHAGVPIAVDDVLRMLGDLLDDTAQQRPFILTTALEPLLRVAPDSELAAELVQRLLDTRIEIDGRRLWPEKLLSSRDQLLLAPSVAHTARAVTVLRKAPQALVGDAAIAAEQWLATAKDINGVTEIVRRLVGEDRQLEQLTIDHFTSAWVARALAGGAAPDQRRIVHALEFVWSRFDSERNLWAWGNGDTPVWMLADAVAALQESAFALLPGLPVPSRAAAVPRPTAVIPPARVPGSIPHPFTPDRKPNP